MRSEPDAAIRHALLRMSKLLRSLTQDMSSITHLVSELAMNQTAALDAGQLEQLQMLDRLGQSLRDLSIVSEILANDTVNMTQDAADLHLSETRAILAGENDVDMPQSTGTVELF